MRKFSILSLFAGLAFSGASFASSDQIVCNTQFVSPQLQTTIVTKAVIRPNGQVGQMSSELKIGSDPASVETDQLTIETLSVRPNLGSIPSSKYNRAEMLVRLAMEMQSKYPQITKSKIPFSKVTLAKSYWIRQNNPVGPSGIIDAYDQNKTYLGSAMITIFGMGDCTK